MSDVLANRNTYLAHERWMEYLKEGSWELSVACKIGKPTLIVYFVLGETGEVSQDHQKPSDVLAWQYNAVINASFAYC